MTEFKLKILTPEGVVYDGMAESVIVRTTVGDKGILAKHEPYVAALTIGQAKIRIDGAVRIGAVSSGIVEVTKDQTSILAQSFEWADEIDVERAEKAKALAEERMKQYNQMAWVGAMNSIRSRAEEVILREMIYEEDAV